MEIIKNFIYEYRHILAVLFIIVSLAYTIYEVWHAPLINCEEDDLVNQDELENQIEEDVQKHLSSPPTTDAIEFKEQLNKIHKEINHYELKIHSFNNKAKK